MNLPDIHQAESLRRLVEQERVTQSLAQITKTQLTTPIGWALILAFSWNLAPIGPVLAWAAMFGLVLMLMVWTLIKLKRYPGTHKHSLRIITGLALVDGLAWGALPYFVVGHDHNLDNWIATVLCGVAAVNAPPRVMIMRGFVAQLAGIWAGIVSFALIFPHTEGAVQWIVGFTVYLGLLTGYMREVSVMMNQNILLRLENENMAGQLKDSLVKVSRQANTDPLTGQLNRRSLQTTLDAAHAHFMGGGAPYALLLLDIDHFKQINDRYGHPVGDEALKAFSTRVAGLLRPTDVLARMGGEEFLVMLRDATPEVAQKLAQRICDDIAETPLLPDIGLQITVSIGLANSHLRLTPGSLTALADRAVYLAKNGGRNQVQIGRLSELDTAGGVPA